MVTATGELFWRECSVVEEEEEARRRFWEGGESRKDKLAMDIFVDDDADADAESAFQGRKVRVFEAELDALAEDDVDEADRPAEEGIER